MVSTAIVLTFVGLLATFVVIGNYMQVRDIKIESARQVKDAQDQMKHEVERIKADLEQDVKNLHLTIQGLHDKIEILSIGSVAHLAPEIYRILGIDHQNIVDNYYVLIKDVPLEANHLNLFVKRFREKYCKIPSNIYLVDDQSIYPLMTQYPLDGDDYLNVADHFVALVPFDSDDVWMYMYQDLRYNELGGKSRKKTSQDITAQIQTE
jgi:hypothetical protein